MPAYEVKRVFKSFPWVEKFVDKGRVGDAETGSMDGRLMVAGNGFYSVALIDVVKERFFYLINSEGSCLLKVGEKPRHVDLNRKWWQIWKPRFVTYTLETIEEAVGRLPDPEAVHFILQVERAYGIGKPDFSLIVYTRPQECSIRKLLE